MFIRKGLCESFLVSEMTTPKTEQIRQQAQKMFQESDQDLPSITATDSELRESGFWSEARDTLMRDMARSEELSYVEKMAHELGFSLQKETIGYLKSCSKTNMLKIPFDIEEAKKSNILISGSNHTGKTRLACGIASLLKYFDWRVIVFDNSGAWRESSDLPFVVTVEGKIKVEDLDIIYDLSYATPRRQRKIVDKFLEDYWNFARHITKTQRKHVMVILEEFEMYGRNARYADNLHRILAAGRNLKIRTLAITTDLALIDPCFIRLCQQRYHGKLGIEENSKRKFRNYYGKDYMRIACEGLEVGDFIYVLNNKIKIVSVPLFVPKSSPKTLEKLIVCDETS